MVYVKTYTRDVSGFDHPIHVKWRNNPKGVVTTCRYRITVITRHFQCWDLGSIPGTCSKWNNRRRISVVERNLGSHRIATFTESWNAPRYSVQIPALMCTSTGYGEQTISKNRRNVSFFNGLACSKALARNTRNVSVVSSILIRSTKFGVINRT